MHNLSRSMYWFQCDVYILSHSHVCVLCSSSPLLCFTPVSLYSVYVCAKLFRFFLLESAHHVYSVCSATVVSFALILSIHSPNVVRITYFFSAVFSLHFLFIRIHTHVMFTFGLAPKLRAHRHKSAIA